MTLLECQSQIRTVPCPKNPSSFSFSCSEGQCSYCGLHLVLTCSLPPGSSRLAAARLLHHNGNPNRRAFAWLTLSRMLVLPRITKLALSFPSPLYSNVNPALDTLKFHTSSPEPFFLITHHPLIYHIFY